MNQASCFIYAICIEGNTTWGFCSVLSHVTQQELPLFEKNLLLLDSLILEGKKSYCSRDKKSGINHLDVQWGYLNNVQ